MPLFSWILLPSNHDDFCVILKGPQNITLAEILGCCHTLLRTEHITNFDDDPPHVHTTDSMNAFTYMVDLQSAARTGRESTDPLFVCMLCIPAFQAELVKLVGILRKRNNLSFRWVESHTKKTTIYHQLNDIADRLCHTALENYYQTLPPIALIEEERLKFNALPQAVRDLY